MSYYGAKGDFYTGRTGYYRGDPGFFSSLARIAAPIASFIPGVGGAVSGVLANIGSRQSQGGGAPPQPSISAAGSAGLGFMGSAGTVAGSAGRGRGRLSGIAARALPSMRGAIPGVGQVPATLPHVARMVGARGMGRRHRRMNVCNPRALRRAIRRAKGFEKLALRSIRLVSPHRLHGRKRGGFKVSRRRK